MNAPWKMKPLDEWSIVGMNHYRFEGERWLFVAMAKEGRLIQAEALDDEFIWIRLCAIASNPLEPAKIKDTG